MPTVRTVILLGMVLGLTNHTLASRRKSHRFDSEDIDSCCEGLLVALRDYGCYNNPGTYICRKLARQLAEESAEDFRPTCNPCRLHPCENGGTCIPTSPASYFCACPPGFTGVDCGVPTPCQPDPCQNGGTCTPDSSSYTCTCPPEYRGTDCGVDVCHFPLCLNGGTCNPTPEIPGFACDCPPEFTGATCSMEVPTPCQPDPCQNGGTCTPDSSSYTCTCPPEYRGTDCGVDVCHFPLCLNGGTCNPTPGIPAFTCDCPPGLTGAICGMEANACDNNPCLNRGTCVPVPGTQDYTCNCPPAYTDTNCARELVRLIGGRTIYEGRVEVWTGTEWGKPCSTLWGREEAQVICSMLGFRRSPAIGIENSFFGAGTGPFIGTNYGCDGTEEDIADCPFSTDYNFCINPSTDSSVLCAYDSNPCFQLQDPVNASADIRVMGGRDRTEGYVEIWTGTEWVWFCGHQWTVEEAAVVCHMLGFDRVGARYDIFDIFGTASGPIPTFFINCVGNENDIRDCPTAPHSFCIFGELGSVICVDSNNGCP